MKGYWLYILVAFFLFEMTLPIYIDFVADISIEFNEAEKESEKEKDSEKEENKRRCNNPEPSLADLASTDFSSLSNMDSFRLSENDFFELNDPPPEY